MRGNRVRERHRFPFQRLQAKLPVSLGVEFGQAANFHCEELEDGRRGRRVRAEAGLNLEFRLYRRGKPPQPITHLKVP
jgi:hypothetical protein